MYKEKEQKGEGGGLFFIIFDFSRRKTNAAPKMSLTKNCYNNNAYFSVPYAGLSGHVISDESGTNRFAMFVAAVLGSGSPVIAFDLEGSDFSSNVNSRIGIMSLARIGENGFFDVILVDCMNEKLLTILLPAIRFVLESSVVLKIVHDCSLDSNVLYHRLNIRLANVLDTSFADRCLRRSTYSMRLNALARLYDVPGNLINYTRDEMSARDFYAARPNFWLTRPLTEELIFRGALDLPCLFVIKKRMLELCVWSRKGNITFWTLELILVSETALRYRRDGLPFFRDVPVMDTTRGQIIGAKGRHLQAISAACKGQISIGVTRAGFGVAASDSARLSLAVKLIQRKELEIKERF